MTTGAFSMQNRLYSQGIRWNVLVLLTWVLATIPDRCAENESKRWLRGLQLRVDGQQFLFHTSLWHLSGSEETILVFEASELIESEIIRVSCFAWKSQNLKGAPKGRVAVKHYARSRGEKCWLLQICWKPPSTVFSSCLLRELSSEFNEQRQKSNAAV